MLLCSAMTGCHWGSSQNRGDECSIMQLLAVVVVSQMPRVYALARREHGFKSSILNHH